MGEERGLRSNVHRSGYADLNARRSHYRGREVNMFRNLRVVVVVVTGLRTSANGMGDEREKQSQTRKVANEPEEERRTYLGEISYLVLRSSTRSQ